VSHFALKAVGRALLDLPLAEVLGQRFEHSQALLRGTWHLTEDEEQVDADRDGGNSE
jgi:hypothetical protein